jgi:hypothetical protein
MDGSHNMWPSIKIFFGNIHEPLLMCIQRQCFVPFDSHFLRHGKNQETTISHQIVTFGGEKDPTIMKNYMTKCFLNINK